jgi:hypothetical protein
MPGKIYRYLADDHERLDALFERAVSDPENIDMSAYGQFRSGLLKHIGMEEKILLPAARRMRGGEPPPGGGQAASRSRRVDRAARADAHGRDRSCDPDDSRSP